MLANTTFPGIGYKTGYFNFMLDNRYHIDSSPDFLDFELISVGLKGSAVKVVRYREINVKGIYNLGFGDKEPVSGYINDLSVTNYRDSQKVLATVASTLYLFTDEYRDVVVIASREHRRPDKTFPYGHCQQF